MVRFLRPRDWPRTTHQVGLREQLQETASAINVQSTRRGTSARHDSAWIAEQARAVAPAAGPAYLTVPGHAIILACVNTLALSDRHKYGKNSTGVGKARTADH